MPRLPHNFPTLRRFGDGNHRQTVLLLGAGISHGLVPLTNDLLEEKRADAESTLGCTSTSKNLYEWADDILGQLKARNDSNPKLVLAQSLDIPFDPRWRGCVSVQRNTPRHRVIARFGREGLWHQIWSLNWDCIQESAFENVGIKHDGEDARLPWPTVFKCFVTAANCQTMGEEYTVKIVKPHGCVMALVKAEEAKKEGNNPRSVELAERFLITKTELDSIHPNPANGTQSFIFTTLCTELDSHPFAIVGWKAAEDYLLDYMDTHVRPVLAERTLANDELSIIVPTFRDTHNRLASFYSKNKSTSHIPVKHDTGFTLDKFFLWLQALYAIGCLNQWAPDAEKPVLEQLAAEIQQPPDPPLFVNNWVDNFLTVWVRLCWRCELIECRDRNGQPVMASHICLESRDEHIPWSIENIDRPELKAASRFLAALHHSGNGDDWDYGKFPGGLYRENHLIIPLPAWSNMAPNDLRGLKPLIDAIKQEGDGYIDKLSVLFLCPASEDVILDDKKKEIKEVLARQLALARFARSESIDEIRLEDL